MTTMKYLLAILAFASIGANAQILRNEPMVGIDRETLGSGTPGRGGVEHAIPVLQNDIFHAPQYMPYYPTAGVIYPRVIEVPCKRVSQNNVTCEGYHWSPKMGRGEYLFFTPKIEPAPSVIVKEVVVPGPVIYKEVPIKKPRE
jgi:hypothetical protein